MAEMQRFSILEHFLGGFVLGLAAVRCNDCMVAVEIVLKMRGNGMRDVGMELRLKI